MDNGTGFVKAGFAGDDFPRCFPCMVGRPLPGGGGELKVCAVCAEVVGIEQRRLVQTSDLTSDMVAAACNGMLAEACVGPCKPYVPGLLSFRPCCSYLLPLQPVYVGAEAAANKQQLYISYPIK